jgi:recombination protein RecT
MATGMTETKQQKRAMTIKDHLTSDVMKEQIAKALPEHCKADRMIRVALTALLRTPKLSECTQESFFKCMMDCSALGLEPDGRLAHLIPYGNTCTLIIDYKGLVALAKRSGQVSNIYSNIVCENDVFDFDTGKVTHKVDFRKPRGNVYAVASVVTFKDGTTQADCMTSDEVEAVRKTSKAAKSGPWVNHWDEMAKKTVFRRLSKWIELSPEYRDSLEKDHDTIDAEFTHVDKKSLSDLTQKFKAIETDKPAVISDDDELKAEALQRELEEAAANGYGPDGKLFDTSEDYK